MNATILKHVLDGDFSSFKEEVSEVIDSQLKKKLEEMKNKLPGIIAPDLNLFEAKDEDEDEDEDKDKKKKKKGDEESKKDDEKDEDEDDDDDDEKDEDEKDEDDKDDMKDKMAKVRAAKK